jgi:hypothetical protein
VLESFKRDVVHGIDGDPIEFFIGFYELLEEYLIRVIEEVTNKRKIIGVFNANL